MDPDKIKLEDLSKNFEFTKISMEVNSIDSIEQLRKICKFYAKLYLKQQETLCDLNFFGDS